jgi:uncharacterized protein YbaP (TraB family)
MRLGLAAVAAAGMLAAPAGAQAPRGLEDPEGTIVEELVVVAREKGPAWWRVKDADTTVYILGIPSGPTPPGVAWDRSTLARRMKGAHSLVMGTYLKARLTDLPAAMKLYGQMKSKTPMEDGLSADLRARFVAQREKIGRPAKRYAGWQPMFAALFLVRDAREKGWTSVDDPIRALAKREKVPVRSTSRYDALPFMKRAMAGLTPQIQAQCLEDGLEDLEAGAGPARRAAEGWARGDLRAALTEPRNFERCLLAVSGGAELWRNATRDNANDVATALKTPGHAVAVINLRRLLAEDGVIEQLEAKGLRVIGPGEAE